MTDTPNHNVPAEHRVKRTGHWLSQDKRHHHKFLNDTVEYVDAHPKDLHEVLQAFQDKVQNDTRLRMLFESMFSEIPKAKPYLTDPTGQSQVRDFPHLVQLINHVLTTAPCWTDAAHGAGLVGVPVNAILDWPMATPAGFAVFQDPEVNRELKKILDAWGQFLSSPKSREVALGNSNESWLSPHGLTSLEEVANKASGTSHSYAELFHCDPKAKYYGYKSWDDFFTRHFRFEDGIRPVASPEDDNVVANACESKFYKVGRDVHAKDQFWIKGQPYSVLDMLAYDELAESFVGGTVYQAFLSALSYHRWHSPVSGTIKKVRLVEGTYYSEPLWEDFSADSGADPDGENTSQEYLSAVATRAIIWIEADNKKLGTVAFIGIGMTEVSTCDTTVKEGQKVKKGDEIGMFHFGGSTHCVLFQKGVKVSGFPETREHNVPIRAKLCVVE